MNKRTAQLMRVAAALRVAIGVGAYTFIYAKGAMRISDHHVRSPLLNLNRSCQTCHKWPESELQTRVETIQGRHFSLRNTAMDALVDFIGDLKSAQGAGKSEAELAPAQTFQRKAQFYLDFVEAENSTGFHAP